MQGISRWRRPTTARVVGIIAVSTVVAVLLWPLAESAAFGPGWGQVLELGIGVAFVSCGLIAWRRRPELAVGPLLLLTGYGWWAHLLLVTREPLLFTIGAVLEISFLPPLAAAVLGFPQRRVRGWVPRCTVGVALLGWLGPGLAATLFLDPPAFGCPDCPEGLNLLLIEGDRPMVERLNDITGWLITAALTALMATVAVRLVRASGPARRVLAPLYGPTVIMAVAYSLYLHVPRLRNTIFDPGPELDRILLVTFGIAVATIPATVLLGMRLSRGRHLRVSRLVRELGEERSLGRLQEALRRVLGDPALALGVRTRDMDERYVRADGTPLVLPGPEDPLLTATLLRGSDGIVGMLVHDRALLIDDRELVQAVAAAARLALDNQQLQEELRRSLEDVRASRARLVKAGDAERYRIERNLHDGAQQRLVSLGIALQLAELNLGEDADPGLRASLAEMSKQMHMAVEELRELALGLHPATLTDQGLGAALESLAARSAVPVSLVRVPDRRLPSPVESTAYYVVAEALANAAKHAHATRVSVRAAVQDEHLELEVRDDGIGGATVGTSSGLLGLVDRVQAVDGRIEIESPRGGGTTIRARLPVTEPARVTELQS